MPATVSTPRTVKLLMKDANLHVARTKGTGNRFSFVARVTDDPYTKQRSAARR